MEMVASASGLTTRPLHLVDVSNRLHKLVEKSIPAKLQNDFPYVMLIHNKWGVLSHGSEGQDRGDESLVG